MDAKLNLDEVDVKLEKVAAQLRFRDRWRTFDEDQCEPGALWASVNSFLTSLDAVCVSLTGHDGLESLQARCQSLTDIVRDLDEILMMYAKHPPSESDEDPPPIDPMLAEWVSECTAVVDDLRREVAQKTEDRLELEDWDVVPEDDGVESIADTDTLLGDENDKEILSEYTDKLEAHCAQIKDFLPIIRCDLNDFLSRTLSSAIPRVTTKTLYRGATEHSHHLQYMRDTFGQTSLTRTRYTLYDLGDAIKAVQSSLLTYETSLEGYGSPNPLPTDDHSRVKVLMKQNEKILKAISEVQSNHGSEWLDSMLNGKFTYADYKSLDLAALKNLTDVYRNSGSRVVSKNVCRKLELENLRQSGFILEKMLKIPLSEDDAKATGSGK